MEQVYTPKQNYKVLVNCMTYNQSKYIEDALNGFAMQKTDFPFVCLVMDDASTDGEQEVIKAWMERECDMEKAEYVEIELSNIILVPHIHNANCTFALYFLKRNLWKEQELKDSLFVPWREHCEYEALCEGDDYWIHPGKLQMQAELLDMNEGVGMCYSKARIYNQTSDIVRGEFGKAYHGIKDLIKCSNIPNVTTFKRISTFHRYIEEITPGDKGWLMGDYPIWLWMEINSKILFIDEVTSAYRILPESASHSLNIEKNLAYVKSRYEIQLLFISKYNLPSMLSVQARDSLSRGRAYCYGASDRSMFIKCIMSCTQKTIKDYVKVLLALFKLYP